VRRICIREYKESEPQPFNELELEALLGTPAVDLLGSPRKGYWIVRAKQYVGVVRIGDLEVRVLPKVPVSRLLFLLGYAVDPKGWNELPADLDVEDDLVAVVGYAFVTQAERAIARGVLQGYRVRDESLPMLRGRLREADQQRRHGTLIPMEVTFDDFTVDITENQFLVTAAELLLRFGVPTPLRRRLGRLRSLLADVTRVSSASTLPPVRFDRLNERYRPAVTLARLILQGRSLEFGVPTAAGSAFLFDMNKVFEDFLTAALGDAFERRGGRVESQHHDQLDEAGRIHIRPDITWWSGKRCDAVVDAKYKPLSSDEAPNTDVYQVFAYCTALDLQVGHLVYPIGEGEHDVNVIRNVGTEVHVHSVPLDKQPERLLECVDEIASRIADLSERKSDR